MRTAFNNALRLWLRQLAFTSMLALACGSWLGAAQEVQVVVSANGGQRLAAGAPLRFIAGAAPTTNTFAIEEATPLQVMAGFGASFLESGMVCLNSLPRETQETLLQALFDPVRGAGFSAMKTPVGGTDASPAGQWYTYDDSAGDTELKRFSIARDLGTNGLVAYIQRARRYGRFVLQAPMDYPPDWMLLDVETNQDVNPQLYDTLARYYVRYLEEYKRQGIEVDYLSLFNEPGIYTKIRYPEIRDLLKANVAPLLARSGLRTRLMFSEAPTREQAGANYPVVLEDAEARRSVAAIAYHGYDLGHFDAIAGLHTRYPDLPLWMTEICHAYGAGTRKTLKLPNPDFTDGNFWGQQIFSDLEAGASAWIYWNMILDENGGPWLVSPIHHNPDPNVQQPLVIVNRKTHQVTFTGGYYYLAHFSKYVRPGSVRLAVRGSAKDARCLAFGTPKGGRVLQLINSRDGLNRVWVKCQNELLEVPLPPVSIVTCLWKL